MRPLVITTTDSIEGYTISEYIEIVRFSMVVGNDIALADLFGGSAKKYSKQYNVVFDKAMQYFRLKAMSTGADAIVGLQTDFEEIFGKGLRKFVVSLVGTAVKLANKPSDTEEQKRENVSLVDLKRQQIVLELRKKFSSPGYAPDEDDWDNILTYALHDLAPWLYRLYLTTRKETISNINLAEKSLLLDNFIPFLQSMGYDAACEVVYDDFTTAPFITSEIIKLCNLFHPVKIKDLLHHDNKHIVISLLDADKPCYSKQDLTAMKKIVSFLDHLPDTGHYEEGRGSIFGKTGTLLVCERGHTSAVELGGHCTESLDHGLGICNLNVKGITEAEVKAISSFKDKVDILSSIIK